MGRNNPDFGARFTLKLPLAKNACSPSTRTRAIVAEALVYRNMYIELSVQFEVLEDACREM
jgi:hypothetical protein